MGFGGGFGRVGIFGLVIGVFLLDLILFLFLFFFVIKLLVIMFLFLIFFFDLVVVGLLNNVEVFDVDMIMFVRDLMIDIDSFGRILVLIWGDFFFFFRFC